MTAKVYVMQGRDCVKVGFSKNPQARRVSLQSRNTGVLSVAAEFPVDDARAVESAAHKMLSERRLEGEWFDASVDEAVAVIRQAIEIVANRVASPKFVRSIQAVGSDGKRQVTLRMDDAEIALLEHLGQVHGGKGAAMMAGLRMLSEEAYDLRAVSSQELLAELQRRLT
jgi:hypothetical protein